MASFHSLPTPPPLRTSLSSQSKPSGSSSTTLTNSRPVTPASSSSSPVPRPSPSKRAYSSPSPNSSPLLNDDEPDQSPRVSRARISKERSQDRHASTSSLSTTTKKTTASKRQGRDDQDEQLLAIPDTPPSPMDDRLIGLGVGILDAHSTATSAAVAPSPHLQQGLPSPPLALATPEEQTRTLMEMPIELSTALNRLCSQHHMSEYNTLKRVVAAQAAQQQLPGPIAFPHTVPPVPASAVLQRSRSTPPVPTVPTTNGASNANQHAQVPRPTVVRYKLATSAVNVPSAAGPSPSLRPPPLSVPSLSAHHDAASQSEGIPSLSRVSTPPPSSSSSSSSSRPYSSLSPGPIRSQTSLTPVFANIGFGDQRRLVQPAPPLPQSLTDALTEAIKGELPSLGVAEMGPPPPVPQLPEVGNMLPGMEVINGVAVKTSASHPMNISAMIPPEQVRSISSNFFSSSSNLHPKKPKSPLMPSTSLSYNASPSLVSSSFAPYGHGAERPFVIKSPDGCDLWKITNEPILPQNAYPLPPATGVNPNIDFSPKDTHQRLLGNFLLSSCPGKKVRLGVIPVKGGRSAICRDVKMDLQRAKDEGVKLVICCLDDQELDYLGAPWDEYVRAISSLELEVIRLPMTEGYAPPSCTLLDAHLERIIKNHTLKGESVLAHCRGGIGRAGLVACCWAIKCGFVSARVAAASTKGGGGNEDENDIDGEEGLGDAMRVVEQVIEVIRRRRSVKAIETALQVNFLLQYVTYLKSPTAKIINSVNDL